MKSVIYVGMDVHKESIAIAVLRNNHKNVEFERVIRNEPGQIKRFFKKQQEKVKAYSVATKLDQLGFSFTDF